MKISKIKITDRNRKKYITLDQCYDIFKSGKFYDTYCSKFVPNGFYCRKLNFHEFIEHYNIGIL